MRCTNLISIAEPHNDSGHQLFQNLAPFGSSHEHSFDSHFGNNDNDFDDEERDAVSSLSSPKLPVNVSINRRTSVSAESIQPNQQPDQQQNKVIIPKTDDQRNRIQKSLVGNFLFKHLESEQYNDVLNAMKEVNIKKDTWVIEQGDDGDYFYVVESGHFAAYIRVPSSSSEIDNSINKPTSCPPEFGLKKVLDYGPGGSFGELALMYNAPRAASILSLSDSTLWAVDRLTFRSILLNHTFSKRILHEDFLSSVELLKPLQSAERSKIADALECRSYEPNSDVITQGQSGDEFFIVKNGKADIIKNGQKVGCYTRGDYFGELALLNSAPRAATVRASPDTELHVITLDEKAFTRLLGPVRDIMARNAETY